MVAQKHLIIDSHLDLARNALSFNRDQTETVEQINQREAGITDPICQLAGNTHHAASGSELDGGFGTEQTPCDLETIVDLQKLDSLLPQRGYPSADIDKIFHGNWLRFFRQWLPK